MSTTWPPIGVRGFERPRFSGWTYGGNDDSPQRNARRQPHRLEGNRSLTLADMLTPMIEAGMIQRGPMWDAWVLGEDEEAVEQFDGR